MYIFGSYLIQGEKNDGRASCLSKVYIPILFPPIVTFVLYRATNVTRPSPCPVRCDVINHFGQFRGSLYAGLRWFVGHPISFFITVRERKMLFVTNTVIFCRVFVSVSAALFKFSEPITHHC